MQHKILQVKQEPCSLFISVKRLGCAYASFYLRKHSVPLLSSRYIEIPQANLANINYFNYGEHDALIWLQKCCTSPNNNSVTCFQLPSFLVTKNHLRLILHNFSQRLSKFWGSTWFCAKSAGLAGFNYPLYDSGGWAPRQEKKGKLRNKKMLGLVFFFPF